jgi:hypothetical protein
MGFNKNKEEDIFPLVGLWNIDVALIMKKEYPPKESSFKLSEEKIEEDKKLSFNKSGIWNLICEEAVDTEHSYIYYTKIYEEILNRGMSVEEINKARKFMWLTAGWLNFVKMYWNWVNLDEKDIRTAIEIQYKEKIIEKKKMEKMNEYIEKIKKMDKSTGAIENLL